MNPDLSMPSLFLESFAIGRGDGVAIVGSGGKATLMYHLAREGVARGYTVVSTSTTHLHPPTSRQSNGLIVAAEEPDWLKSLPGRLASRRHITVVGARPRPDKMQGLDFETLESLRRVCTPDLLLIKADGARTRPFKAPDDHEPTVPDWATHCIIVAGLQGVGVPLDERYVHRSERVAALSGLHPGESMTPEAIARVIGHPDAYLKAFPSAAKTFLYLGWCNNRQRRQTAEDICRHVAPDRIPRVLCGNIEQDGLSLETLR